MEREEAETAARLEAEAAAAKAQDPAKDPANIAWMEEQIRKEKEAGNDNFGDDLNINFEGK